MNSSSDSTKKLGVTASKGRVSFAVEVEERTIPSIKQSSLYDRPNTNKVVSKSIDGDDDVEDLLDPDTLYSGDGEDDEEEVGETWEERKEAREAKTQRALRRISDHHAVTFKEDIELHSSYRSFPKQQQQQPFSSNRESILGEEDTDKHFSLFFDRDRESSQDQNPCPIEPFNLKSEREDGDGYFDGDTYVFRRKRNPEEEEDDAWLQQMENEESNTYKNATTEGYYLEQQPTIKKKPRNKVNSMQDRMRHEKDDKMSKEEIYNEIASFMARDNETVLQAISRYGSIMKNEKKRKRVLNESSLIEQHSYEVIGRNHNDELAMDNILSSAHVAIHRLTELTNICMIKFDDGKIFELTRANLKQVLYDDNPNHTVEGQITMAQATKSKYFDVGSLQTNNDEIVSLQEQEGFIKQHVQWEYKGNQDDSIHGPYTTEQMLAWIQAGYFVGESSVDVRVVTNRRDDKKNDDVQDLLGDLDDFDGAAENTSEEKCSANNRGDWIRSDTINFGVFL